MSRILIAVSLAALLAAGAVSQSRRGGTTEPSSTAHSLALLCEVWTVTSSELEEHIEALSELEPDNAAQIRELLQQASNGAERLTRILAPTTVGSEVSIQSRHEVPFITVSQGQNTTQTGFGGTRSAGTRFSASTTTLGDGQTQMRVTLEISSFAEGGSSSPAVPPPSKNVNLQGSIAAPNGVLRMFQAETGGPETMVVFLRASQI